MGFFENDGAAPPTGSLAPLSQERIIAALEREGISYTFDSNDDLAVGLEHGGFFFFIGGQFNEYLRILGRWYAFLPTDMLGEAIQACNEWNTQTIWPKTYAVANDVNEVVILSEHSVDYEHGVSDLQITQHLACAITTSMQFFEYLNESFPDEWAAYQAQIEAQELAVAEAQAVAEAEVEARYNLDPGSVNSATVVHGDQTAPDSLVQPRAPHQTGILPQAEPTSAQSASAEHSPKRDNKDRAQEEDA